MLIAETHAAIGDRRKRAEGCDTWHAFAWHEHTPFTAIFVGECHTRLKQRGRTLGTIESRKQCGTAGAGAVEALEAEDEEEADERRAVYSLRPGLLPERTLEGWRRVA